MALMSSSFAECHFVSEFFPINHVTEVRPPECKKLKSGKHGPSACPARLISGRGRTNYFGTCLLKQMKFSFQPLHQTNMPQVRLSLRSLNLRMLRSSKMSPLDCFECRVRRGALMAYSRLHAGQGLDAFSRSAERNSHCSTLLCWVASSIPLAQASHLAHLNE